MLPDAMAVIGELDSIHWFCQSCEIEIFRVINESGKNADFAVSTDSTYVYISSVSTSNPYYCISEGMKNLDTIVVEVTKITKNIGVKEFDLVNVVCLGSRLPNKLRLL